MKVLGIEAATPLAGAAVVDGQRLLAQSVLDVHRAPAERLLSLVERVLADGGLGATGACAARTVPALDLIAVSAGPGSFTGIRVGFATAAGLAQGSGLPLAGVPTLSVLAAPLASAGLPVLALLDARRGEVYYALFYGWGATGPRLTTGPGASRPQELAEQLAESLPDGRIAAVGSGASLAREALEEAWPGRFIHPGAPADGPQPAWTAVLGAMLHASGAAPPPEPIYVRRSDAEEARHGGDRR